MSDLEKMTETARYIRGVSLPALSVALVNLSAELNRQGAALVLEALRRLEEASSPELPPCSCGSLLHLWRERADDIGAEYAGWYIGCMNPSNDCEMLGIGPFPTIPEAAAAWRKQNACESA